MNTTLMNGNRQTEEMSKQTNGSATPYQATFVPRFDIWEGPEELVLYGDLPGVTPENLDICFENRELTIHGKVCPRTYSGRLVAAEYGVGDFYRTFSIGEAIDAEKISAEVLNGVLTVHLPKSEIAKPRRIAVQAK